MREEQFNKTAYISKTDCVVNWQIGESINKICKKQQTTRFSFYTQFVPIGKYVLKAAV